MTNFDCFKAMSLDTFAKWLDKYGQFDGSPWMDWFNTNYCSRCELISVERKVAEDKLGISALCGGTTDCAWCELHKKCKYFLDLENIPDNEDIIKMWLNVEAASGKDL